jgi:CheY-like chemotaxis protein
MPQGGKISIGSSAVEVGGNSPAIYRDLAAEPGEYVRVRVADNGSGIPRQNLDKIFDPFFTTKEVGKGSGLGLAMVYGIVQNARGYVHVESQEGKGTTFELLFRVTGSGENQKFVRQLDLRLGGDETVLLVDDEPLVRDLGREILRSYGYNVVLAGDGLEALETYEQNSADIDLVILDLLMPNMGGEETLIKLRKLAPETKVIICSGYGGIEKDPQPAFQGEINMVHKPFKPEELVSAVRQMLDSEEVSNRDEGEKREVSAKVIALRR